MRTLTAIFVACAMTCTSVATAAPVRPIWGVHESFGWHRGQCLRVVEMCDDWDVTAPWSCASEWNVEFTEPVDAEYCKLGGVAAAAWLCALAFGMWACISPTTTPRSNTR